MARPSSSGGRAGRVRGRRGIGGFLRHAGGMGAVEFALIAPFLFALYLGGSELSIAVTIHRKVDQTAATLNDLVTQSSSLTDAQLEGIYAISKALFVPYSAEGLKIRVTSVYIDSKGKQTVDWSCPTQGMAKLSKGAAFLLPGEFAALRNRYLMVAETRFAYSPITASVFTGAIEMGGTSYLDPRIGSNVVSAGCSTITL